MSERVRRVGLFVGITFILSWLTVILFSALGGKWETYSGLMIGVVFMFMPMISAVLVQRFVCREQLKEPLGISLKLNRWWLVAWLLPLLITTESLAL